MNRHLISAADLSRDDQSLECEAGGLVQQDIRRRFPEPHAQQRRYHRSAD